MGMKLLFETRHAFVLSMDLVALLAGGLIVHT